jgi:hypothetical protein
VTAALAGVRAAIASALSSLGIPVHTYPPNTPGLPSCYLIPGSPYLDPGIGWGTSEVGIDVRIVVNAASGPDAMERLDALVDAAVAALVTAKIGVQSIGAPYTSEDSAVLAVDIPTLTAWKAET